MIFLKYFTKILQKYYLFPWLSTTVHFELKFNSDELHPKSYLRARSSVSIYWIRWRLNGIDKYAIRLSIRKKMPRNSYTLYINYDHRLSFASGIGKPILIVQVNCIYRYFSIFWLLMPRFHRSLKSSRLSPLIADLLPLFASCQRNKVRKLGPQLIAA